MKILAFTLLAFVLCSVTQGKETSTQKVRILLIGDSTTEGGKPIFEQNIELLLAGKDSIPPVEVINVGRGGETAYSLLNSGRYDKEISDIDSVDYIFLRYGINDWFKRKPLEDNFPIDMKDVIKRLRTDFEEAQIIVMTIIPFLDDEKTFFVNKLITQVAKSENLELFDIFPAYKKGLEEFGINSMNVRFFPLNEIPVEFHKSIASYTEYINWKKADCVIIKTTEFDPLLGHLAKWYDDRHPNPMGYRLMAKEIAGFIQPKLKAANANK